VLGLVSITRTWF